MLSIVRMNALTACRLVVILSLQHLLPRQFCAKYSRHKHFVKDHTLYYQSGNRSSDLVHRGEKVRDVVGARK